MTKITSSFTGGLNQDLAISKNQNKTLINALDIDIITDVGESTAIISNHKGNRLEFRIPNIQPLYSIVFSPVGTIQNAVIQINGTNITINLSPYSSAEDIYNQIISNPTINSEIVSQYYGIYYSNSQIVIQGYSLDPSVTLISGDDLTVSMVVPAQTDLCIIGWCTLEEEIILFTTSKDNINPSPSNAGQIWLLKYNNITDEVESLSGTFLNPFIHLKYNNLLNFSLQNEIYREAIGRKESSLRGNIYWTDDYNHPRVINVYNPQCPAIPVEMLDWKSSINLSTPIILGVLQGGNLLAGSYQVAYQLYSKDGAISVYSPTSTLVPITDSSLSSPFYMYDGAEMGINSGKSIQVQINHIDKRYDFIRLVLIQYESEDLPIINIVNETPITGESMTFVISGAEDKISVSVEEFVNPLIYFNRCKTFTQKKNRLYPANTQTDKFDVDWDSRAYRFNSSQVCRLWSINGSFQDYVPSDLLPGGALYNLSETADAVNAYNDESGTVFGLIPTQNYDTWLSSHQYKYQSDGITLGGEGPNVKYTFTAKQYRGDDIYLDSIPYNSVESTFGIRAYYMINTPMVNVINYVTGSQNLGTPALTGFDHPLNGWDSIKNPMYATLFGSFARGEVYRFGIVFYNNKGEESFVKWISDIRIPEPWEDTVADLSYYDSVLNMEVRAIGIQFELKNLPSNITGFRIVRVERQEKDKTRFGTGVLFGLLNGRIDLSGAGLTQCKMLYSFANSDPTGGNNPPEIPIYFINNDFAESSPGVGEEAPANHGPQPPSSNPRITRFNTLGIIKFPNFDFSKYSVNSASHFKILHEYTWPEFFYTGFYYTHPSSSVAIEYLNSGVCYWSAYIANGVRQAGAFITKLRDIVSRGRNIYTLNNQLEVGIEGIVTSSFNPGKMGGEDYHHIGIYTLPDDGGVGVDWELSGFATKSLFVDFNGIPYNADTPYLGSYINNPTSGPKNTRFKLVSLCKFNLGQYGGPWRSARYNNTYIACSDFIPVKALTSPIQTIDVYGGDTYVSYYSTTLSFFHWNESYGIDTASPSGLGNNYDPVSKSMSAIALAFPTESEINLEYRDGKYWNKDQVFSSNTSEDVANPPSLNSAGMEFAKFLADEYTYNESYSQENNIKKYIPKPLNFDMDERHPNWIWASNTKFDREIIDNWRIYPINNFLSLEGIFGPINKVVTLKEKIISYQTKGISFVSSEETSALPDAGTGAVFQVGTGSVLSRYDYISKEFGSLHQHSVILGPGAVYSFDAINKKVIRVSDQLDILSDVSGMSSFFRKLSAVKTDIDKPLLFMGSHGVYDTKYNKIYMTFMDSYILGSLSSYTINGNQIIYSSGTWGIIPILGGSYPNVTIDDIFEKLPAQAVAYQNNVGYDVTIDVNSSGDLIVTFIGLSSVPPLFPNLFRMCSGFTIAYNESLRAFESFYSFKPFLYINSGRRLLSTNPYDYNGSVYCHNKGNYGQFYNRQPSISEAEFIVNFPDGTKVPTLRIDTLEFWTEVFDSNGIDIPFETITGIILYNDYQTTGNSLTILTPQVNVVRRERTWRINHIRDQSSVLGLKPFLRDKYVKIKIFYNNQNNRYFRLHEFNTNVTLSYY